MLPINPTNHAIRLTTTLNLLLAKEACAPRYRHLVRSLGGLAYGQDKPINLLYILKSNGVEDVLWALRATQQSCRVVARLMACDFAEEVLPLYECIYPNDARLRNTIETGRRYALGLDTKEARDTARQTALYVTSEAIDEGLKDVARAAAAASWWDDKLHTIPGAAAGYAAWAAARTARKSKTGDAADKVWVAAWKTTLTAQGEIIRQYLLP
jgi:hypothetical protein